MRSLLKAIILKLVDASEIRKVVREEIDAALIQQLRNIDYGLHFKAIMKSADFVYENIPLHKRYSITNLWTESIKIAPAEGLMLEFGVYNGNSIRFFASLTSRTIYGFDSFEGIPDAWTLRRKGDFAVAALPEVPKNVKLVKGWFSETLPEFLAANPGAVSFIHMDCDLYSSTQTVLELLVGRIQAGTVIVLDDFLEEPGFEKEEHLAFFEFVEKFKVEFEYIGYTTTVPSSPVSIIIKSIRHSD